MEESLDFKEEYSDLVDLYSDEEEKVVIMYQKVSEIFRNTEFMCEEEEV